MEYSNRSSKSLQLIDENIKRVYQEALEEEVPDKFRQLLEKLKLQENAEPGSSQ